MATIAPPFTDGFAVGDLRFSQILHPMDVFRSSTAELQFAPTMQCLWFRSTSERNVGVFFRQRVQYRGVSPHRPCWPR